MYIESYYIYYEKLFLAAIQGLGIKVSEMQAENTQQGSGSSVILARV